MDYTTKLDINPKPLKFKSWNLHSIFLAVFIFLQRQKKSQVRKCFMRYSPSGRPGSSRKDTNGGQNRRFSAPLLWFEEMKHC